MKKFLVMLAFAMAAPCIVNAQKVSGMTGQQKLTLKTGVNPIDMVLDGEISKGGWTVMPDLNPDILETPAAEIKFVTDVDSIVMRLDEWKSMDFDILTQAGDTAHVRVRRTSVSPFDNPDPELLKVAPSGKLTKEQAEFDISALIYTLNQVHPDIFSVCGQANLMKAVNSAVNALPDSVSQVELYRLIAPVVAMIGDGHTNLYFPYNSFMTYELDRMPVFIDVMSDGSLVCVSSLDSIVPKGSKVLNINGKSAEEILESMMPFVSGEKRHYKLSQLYEPFQALFQMLYHADNYVVEYIPEGGKKPLTHTFPAVKWEEIKKRCPSTQSDKRHEAYSFEIDRANNVAVMDFRSFVDAGRMEQFADSMFTAMRTEGIENLIIDLRNNSGGNSRVGDVLLSYISPVPFDQIVKMLVKITPTTAKLMGNPNAMPMLVFHESGKDDCIQPRTEDNGHFQGKVYLLTSNRTFSSAGLFAWTFKECGIGTVVGEETGGMSVHFGDVLGYKLPVSKMFCSVSYKRFWQMNADENDIHGTLPDVAVPASEAMEAAMKLVKGN